MRPAARPRTRPRPPGRPDAPGRMLALASGLLALAILAPPPGRAQTESASAPIPDQAVDLVVLRPLGAARLAAGAALWVPVSLVQAFMDVTSAAFSPLGFPSRRDARTTRETLNVFVVEPANYLFRRPLGRDLEEN